MRLFLALYDMVWGVVVVGWLVFRVVCRPRGMRAVPEHLGFVPARPRAAPVAVWLHAVSVGELLASQPVLTALKRQHPDWWALLTTTHPQAYALARAHPMGADAVCPLPWDFGPCIETALKRARPDLVVLVECELWPNFVLRSAARGARVLMMNGRIYERDMPRYLLGRRWFAPILQRISYIGAQSEGDLGRFLELGAPAERTALAGNTKFDVRLPDDLSARLAALRAELPLRAGPLWVLASTHEGEEKAILSRCRPLWQELPGLQLLIAPRHIDRTGSIKEMAEGMGFKTSLRSQPCLDNAPGGGHPDVILLDTVGELSVLLGLADLVFVGGSLVDRGGHNPIEAALHARPIVMGPSVFNFQYVVSAFSLGKGILVVRDADELLARASSLLGDPAACERLGQNATRIVAQHGGAARNYLRQITRLADRSRKAA